MRKSLWIILAVLFVAIGAPYAHADALVYTYTVTFDPSLYGATFTTKPMQAVTAPNAILTTTDLRSYSLTGSFYLGTFDEFILNYGGGGAQGILTSNGLGTASATYSSNDAFTLIDYSAPGTYSSGIAIKCKCSTRACHIRPHAGWGRAVRVADGDAEAVVQHHHRTYFPMHRGISSCGALHFPPQI